MTRTSDQIRDISVEVYKKLLAADAGGNDTEYRAKEWERMVAKDGDNGEKLRNRAGSYDRIARLVLESLEDRVRLSPTEIDVATNGTIVWNDGPLKGEPIGLNEMRHRKTVLFFLGT